MGKVAFALLVVAMMGLAIVEWRYQRELAAADSITELGGRVEWSRVRDSAEMWQVPDDARRSHDREDAGWILFLRKRFQHVVRVDLRGDPTIIAEGLPALLRFRNVTQLDLAGNQLMWLPPEIGLPTNLIWLRLTDNQLRVLPAEIGKLTNLKQLELGFNQIEVLPPEIAEFKNLNVLNLQFNRLTGLPPEIGTLTTLKQLNIMENQLTTLPPEIGGLVKLEVLHLHNNQLAGLPPEIGKLTQLSMLVLSGNAITDNDLMYLKSLKNLRHLEIGGTKVTEEGVEELRQALPQCQIFREFLLNQ